MKAATSTHAIGRRKSAQARAFLDSGKGEIICNGRAFEDYFNRPTLRIIVKQPLVALDMLEKFDIYLNLTGGGPGGQAEAARLAISRALCKLNAESRPALKKEGFLTRDPREVERKKYGRHKARKRPQFSKR